MAGRRVAHPSQLFSVTLQAGGWPTLRVSLSLTNNAGGRPRPQYLFDNNNRISGSGVTYDALGNILNDGLGNTFTYDAESRLIKVVNAGGTYNYTYDAEGRRVRNNTSEFLYDLSGRAITLFGTTDGIWNYGEIYAGGRHLATYSGSTTNFLHSDWLGTKRVMSSISCTNSQTCTSLPFGDGSSCIGTEWNFNHFTDDIHDSESNLEHTWFRQFSSTQGRWTSPDPYLGSVDVGNPQSLNRYSYVIDNALSLIDPLGLSHGNDCNGGACTPFMYVDANGCTNFVAFAPVKGPDGQTFDYPYIAGQICSGTSAVNTAGSGDGGGVGVNGKPAIAPCPSKTVQFFADVVVGANPAMLAAQKLAQKTGGVVQLGAGFTGTIGLSGIPGLKLVPILNKLGIGASASVSWVFDKAGNVGLAFSAGPAAGVGGGAVMGGQLSLSLAADSIFDIAGRSTSFGIGGGEGVGVAIEGSNNAYGTASATVGLGEGGFALLPGGSYTNTGLIPLVCK